MEMTHVEQLLANIAPNNGCVIGKLMDSFKIELRVCDINETGDGKFWSPSSKGITFETEDELKKYLTIKIINNILGLVNG